MNVVCGNIKQMSVKEHAGDSFSPVCLVAKCTRFLFFYDGRFVETAFFVSLRKINKKTGLLSLEKY